MQVVLQVLFNDISANTIRCDGPQFCILKVMVFGIVCIIPPSHKCNEEGPSLCMGSSTFLVHWSDNIGGIHIGPSRPAATASGPSEISKILNSLTHY